LGGRAVLSVPENLESESRVLANPAVCCGFFSVRGLEYGGGNPSRGEDVGVSLRARRGWRRPVQRPSRISGTALAWIAAAFSALGDRQHRYETAATDTARMASAGCKIWRNLL